MTQKVKTKNDNNYFGATPDRPYHFSVGVIVLDEDTNIICLHYPELLGFPGVFALPNWTLQPNHTLEEAAREGAKKELGADITVLAYLGNLVVQDTWFGELGMPRPVEKNVAYFLTKAISIDESLAADENVKEKRTIVHKTFDFLIDTMTKQEVRDGMRDFAQGAMVTRAKQWIEEHPELIK